MGQGPVVLFRAWRTIPGRPELFGVYRRYAWRPREQTCACIRNGDDHDWVRRIHGEQPIPKHTAPADPGVHRCGFGGYFTLDDVADRFNRESKVFGAFLAWGTIFRGELAARAEVVAPLALEDDSVLIVDRTDRALRRAMLAGFAQHYRIPLLPEAELLTDVVRFGELLGDPGDAEASDF